MSIDRFCLACTALLMCLALMGCAGSGAVRGAAMQLQSQVSEYERLIDNKITSQNTFYKSQIALIEQSRQNTLVEAVESFHRTRSAAIASEISVDPSGTARLAHVTDCLIQTTDAEYQLYQQLYDNEVKANTETEAMIAKLQRQKDLLERVKSNLNQLGTAPKRRAQMLLSISEDAFNQVKSGK